MRTATASLRTTLVLLVLCIIAFLLSFVAVNLFASTYTVKSPQSINSQLAALQPGDTLMVRAGTYTESLSLPRSGTASKPIVLMAYPDEKPVIKSNDVLLSLSQSYWIIDGLTFDQQGVAVDAIRIRGDAKFSVLRNCDIRNGQRDGIEVNSGSDITIENNLIHNFVWAPGQDAHGIVTDPGILRVNIINNVIYDCGGDCIQLYASGSDPVSAYSKDFVIKGNRLYTTLGANSENALDFKGIDGALIAGNEMYGFQDKAIVVQKGCRNLTFETNLIHDSQRGMEFRGEDGLSQVNLVVRHNVIYNISDYYAIKFDWVDNVQFVNNTIANATTRSFLVEEEGVTHGVFKNNLIYDADTPKITGTFDAQVGNNGWFNVSSGPMAGSNDKSGSDPGFVNASQYDFRLTANSPVINAGTDVGLPFTGSAPDLGAFEFGATTGVTFVSFSAAAQNSEVRLSWSTASESNNQGFAIERSTDGKNFQAIGFVEASQADGNHYGFIDRGLDPGRYYYRLRQQDFNGTQTLTEPVEVLISIPDEFLLEQNWPNPFSLSKSSTTRFAFSVPRGAEVIITIYNILGQQQKQLFSSHVEPGKHSVVWDGTNARGQSVSPGVYFYEMRAGSVKIVRSFATIE